ncbi:MULTISPECIES: hypothetical protein [Pseudomonas]|uniref:hypothetical protein n=1 Tax=Pseudomonas TaxID=286 RepID=UPI0039062933
MAITEKIQQIISELRAAEELLHAQSRVAPQLNSQPSSAVLVSSKSSHQTLNQISSDLLHTTRGLPEQSGESNQATLDLNFELENLRNENQRLSRELYNTRKESIISKNSEQQVISENQQLLSELAKVQSELEQYYQDKVALEAALATTNKLIDRASETIFSLQQDRSCDPY